MNELVQDLGRVIQSLLQLFWRSIPFFMDLVVNLTLLSANDKPIDTIKQGVTQTPGTLLTALCFLETRSGRYLL